MQKKEEALGGCLRFDEVIDRSGSDSAKYDERIDIFGTQNVIPLWVADMDFKAPQPVIDALTERAQNGIFGYVSRPDSYFDAICEWQRKRNGWHVDKSMISFSLGVVPALSAIVHLFSEKGDKVIIQPPVYPEFYDVVETWEREVLLSPLVEINGRYTVDFDDFENKLRSRPKIFILCSPHNPLGTVWTRDELTRMCELCACYDVLIVSDEIHSDLILWGNKHTPTASISREIASRTITCVSGTKTFNLAGLQASATIFPNSELKEVFDGFWAKFTISRNNSFSLVAMETAFRRGEEWLKELISYLEGNILFVHDYCQRHIPQIKPNIPQSTYLIWLNCTGLNLDNQALHSFMIEKAGLGLSDGHLFDRSLSGYMRLNAACPRSVLEKAMKQLKEAVEELGV